MYVSTSINPESMMKKVFIQHKIISFSAQSPSLSMYLIQYFFKNYLLYRPS